MRLLTGARRLLAAAILAVAAAALAPAPGSARELGCRENCSPGHWQEAIGLSEISGHWRGEGVTVASIDTGVRPTGNLGGRLLARVDLTSDHDGLDRFGHGTHLAGLIAGDGSATDRDHEGAAPGAGLVSVKVASWDGATDVSTVIAALRWVVAHRERYGIRVVSLAWGTDSRQPPAADPLNAAVEQAWRAGLVVVVAAGNAGAGHVVKPADDPFAITVGAVDTAGTVWRGDDTRAPFSGHGRTAEGAAKPDVLAPGVSLVSDRARGSTVDVLWPQARLGGAMFRGTGTSQAAAVVAGVAARMLGANPGLAPGQVKAALIASAPDPAGPVGGAGMIDAAAAVAAVAPPAVPPASADPAIAPSSGGGSLDLSRGSQRVLADPDGDGQPAPVAGEVDVLGRAWDPSVAWTAGAWAASPWAPVTAVVPGNAAAPPWTGPPGPRTAWDAGGWAATSPEGASWEAKYWGAKYWGAKYWGAKYWGTDQWR